MDRQIEVLLHDLATTRVPTAPVDPASRRFAERSATHPYPTGFARRAQWMRDDLMIAQRMRVEHMQPDAYAAHRAAHDALAWALDAERFLGSVGLAAERVDEVAGHFLAWLGERGYQLVPTHAGRRHDRPALPAHLALHLEFDSGLVLDEHTRQLCAAVEAGALDPGRAGGEPLEMNTTAATWGRTLALSTLLPGETPPPSGHAGQYGRHGCVLVETVSDAAVVFHDVRLVFYDIGTADRFIEEVLGDGTLTLVDADFSDDAMTSFVPSYGPDDRRAGIDAAVAWGRSHARRLAAIGDW